MLAEVGNAFCCREQNSKAPCECNIPRHKFAPRRLPPLQTFYTHNISTKGNFFELGNKANPPRLSLIFSVEAVPYSQTSNPVYNTVRNEIRRIDNFEEKEIRRKGKKYKLNSRIHASRHYHKGNRDQAGFLYELFYFPSTSKSPRKASRICKC